MYRSPITPPGLAVVASGTSFITLEYATTTPTAASIMITRPIRKRVRVSSHDLYQSMSALCFHGLEKDLFQRDGNDVDRRRVERARLGENLFGSRARQHGEHAALAPHALDARRAECRRGGLVVEHQLNRPEVL